MTPLVMNHFTDTDGFKAIAASTTWRFVADQPPGDHPFGAYFTTASPDDPKLWKKLMIPKRKREFVFSFVDRGDLTPLRGGRGRFIFFSPEDYEVEPVRQLFAGEV
jgi:hypothetical protein